MNDGIFEAKYRDYYAWCQYGSLIEFSALLSSASSDAGKLKL